MRKIEFEGKVEEQFIDFSDGYNCYADIRDDKDGSWLTEQVRVLEGKRVRVLIEVIDEEEQG